MKTKEFDLFIIGTGSAAKKVAYAGAEAKLSVGITDVREYGGTCANRGCDPKKVLVGVTEILADAEDMRGKGITGLPKLSWNDLMTYKKTFTDPVPYVHERDLKKAGITTFHGSPQFVDEQTLILEGIHIRAKKIVIASGQKQKPLPIPGGSLALTSDDFLSLEQLPKSILFIGAGYIGMELAHVANRFGVETTLIHSGSRPLKNFDPDLVDLLTISSQNNGIHFLFNARANKIEVKEGEFIVHAEQNGKEVTRKAAMVINSAGRGPAIEGLNLEEGTISFTKKGISVNEKLQSLSNPHVYACGDVADSPGLPLSPLAPYEAGFVINQLMSDQQEKATYPVQPSVVFTSPNLASVGLKEEEAKNQGRGITVHYKDAHRWYKAKQTHSQTYAFKVVIEKKSRKILGAHLIGKAAAETINLFAMAINCGLTTDDLKGMIFSYPTWANEIKSMV